MGLFGDVCCCRLTLWSVSKNYVECGWSRVVWGGKVGVGCGGRGVRVDMSGGMMYCVGGLFDCVLR